MAVLAAESLLLAVLLVVGAWVEVSAEVLSAAEVCSLVSVPLVDAVVLFVGALEQAARVSAAVVMTAAMAIGVRLFSLMSQ